MLHKMPFARSLFLIFLLACLLTGLAGTVRVAVDAAPQMQTSTQVVISQVYGGGGNAGAPYRNDFIELFNPGVSPVSINGWSVQYASDTGTSWQVTGLPNISLAAGQYFLIQMASGGANGSLLPVPDVTGTTSMGASAGKVVLVNSTTALSGNGCPINTGVVVDFVGYGTTADCREGGATTASNAPAPSNTTADIRNANGCNDTDQNNADFATGAPIPRNRNSIGFICGVGTYTPTPPNVVINEIAWAGTLASSDDEWIELYNSGGTDVDISGWRLVAQDGAPDIIFPSGTTITAGSYFLLERAREQVTDVPSDFIFFGALDDTGEVLRLRRPDGTVVDTANANGGPWPAGGISPNASMERYNTGVENDSIWGSNDGTVIWNGLDASGNPIRGTPRNANWAATVTATPTRTLTPTVTNTGTATSTGTATNTGTPTNTSTPAGFLRVIISEVAWMGTGASTADEWIELYNPGTTTVDLAGWVLRADDTTPNITFPSGKTIPPGGYFLLERTDDNTVIDVTADYIYTGELSNSFEVLRLYDPSNRLIDTANSNGGSWPAGSTTTLGTMERRGVVADSDTAWFTNVNPASWTKHDARGTGSTSYLIRGTPGYSNWAFSVTATPSPIPTATRRPTSTAPPLPPPPPPLVAINEFVPRPGSDWNNDGVVNTGDEYIELLNHGVVPVNLGGYRLDDEANIGSSPYTLPSTTLQPGDRIVFYGSETGLLLSDGGDGVRLLKSNGQLADAYNYFTVEFPDQAFCRLPDNGGADDWNTNCFPTPGLKNSLSGSILRPPTQSDEDQPLCPIADTLPQDFVIAECTPVGNNIWNRYYWDRFGWYGEEALPEVNGKWEVYAD